MKLSNLYLFIATEDTGCLVDLSNTECRHSSLSYSYAYCFVLMPPDTIVCMCRYSQKVRRQFKLHEQSSFSCLTGPVSSHTSWDRNFLSGGQTITRNLRL